MIPPTLSLHEIEIEFTGWWMVDGGMLRHRVRRMMTVDTHRSYCVGCGVMLEIGVI